MRFLLSRKIKFLLFMINNISFVNWFLIGFLSSYLAFFIKPIFFSTWTMNFPHYIPIIDPIGYDLKQMLSYSESWYLLKDTPYIGANLYPPLTAILFTPFLFLRYSLAYKLITLVNVICYLFITVFLPLRINRKNKFSSLMMFIFLTGLFSYGFQFELERGQFNIIAITFCLLAIWIFHHYPKIRIIAYILFTISVQLKVFPFIFIVLFIDNWKEIKQIFLRFIFISIINFSLLMIMGTPIFFNFIEAIKKQSINPGVWVGNHSIRSYITQSAELMLEKGSYFLMKNSEIIQILLLFIVLGCLLLIMFRSYQQNLTGINSNLILACAIGAMLIPSVSHDYKLSILISPFLIFVNSHDNIFNHKLYLSFRKLINIFIILVISIAYSSTLFSFSNKPILLQNNFPFLFILLLMTTWISFRNNPNKEPKMNEKQIQY